jgi:hypothetical protein
MINSWSVIFYPLFDAIIEAKIRISSKHEKLPHITTRNLDKAI